MKEKSLTWYDPLKSTSHRQPEDILKNVYNFLQKRNRIVENDYLDIENMNSWICKTVRYPRQNDASSCGLYVCLYGYAEVHGLDMNSEMKMDVGKLRLFVAATLMKKPKVETAKIKQSLVLDSEGAIDEEAFCIVEKKLVSIVRCDEKECKKVDHMRHHAFIYDPEKFLKLSKKRAGYGSDKFGNEKLDELVGKLKERLMSVRKADPKRPYSGGNISTIKGVSEESKLQKLFNTSEYMALRYILNVLWKEAEAYFYALESDVSYEDANRTLEETEANV